MRQLPQDQAHWATRGAAATTLMTLLLVAAPALADSPEASRQLPTDGAYNGMFPVNPAALKPQDLRPAILGERNRRATTLDHAAQGGTKVATKVSDEALAVTMGLDLGAGAGIAVEQAQTYHLLEATIDNRSDRDPIREVAKRQETSVKLVVEMTAELRAAIVMRFLETTTAVLGQPFLDPSRVTRYRTTMVGYGCGLTYNLQDGGAGYTYYPPLHGKAQVAGEERIVVEPGLIALDGYWQPGHGRFLLGLLAKRWIIQADDLAIGSTAADNKTRISFYGLDPDQYLVRTQLLMLGGDLLLTKDLSLRLAVGREDAHFDFKNMLVFDGAGVRQQGQDLVVTNRLQAAARAVVGSVDLELGLAVYSRSRNFSADEGGGTYRTSGQELSLALGLHL